MIKIYCGQWHIPYWECKLYHYDYESAILQAIKEVILPPHDNRDYWVIKKTALVELKQDALYSLIYETNELRKREVLLEDLRSFVVSLDKIEQLKVQTLRLEL